jgi:hypothetical protein
MGSDLWMDTQGLLVGEGQASVNHPLGGRYATLVHATPKRLPRRDDPDGQDRRHSTA